MANFQLCRFFPSLSLLNIELVGQLKKITRRSRVILYSVREKYSTTLDLRLDGWKIKPLYWMLSKNKHDNSTQLSILIIITKNISWAGVSDLDAL